MIILCRLELYDKTGKCVDEWDDVGTVAEAKEFKKEAEKEKGIVRVELIESFLVTWTYKERLRVFAKTGKEAVNQLKKDLAYCPFCGKKRLDKERYDIECQHCGMEWCETYTNVRLEEATP